MNAKIIFFFSMILLLIVCMDASTSYAALDNYDILDSVLAKYKTAASSWATIIQERATWLFFTLATISMVWTFIQLFFHRSSFAEFFGEFIRFIMFTGTFLWFLQNAPTIADAIIVSLRKIGAQASGQSIELTPSGIVDIGFKVLDTASQGLEATTPSTWFAFLIACIILIILALVGINMLLQLCAAWVLAYAGIFFLGFGGSKWTSDMAINYFKTVLGIGASLMTMTLLVGVGTGIVADAQAQMQATPNTNEMGVLLVFSLTLLLLVDKLPAMVAGIVTGAGIGSIGGGFGAGAAVGAAMTAAAAVSGAASVASSAATGAAGIASALKAASQSVSGSAGGTAGGAGGGAGGGVSEGGRSLGEIMGAGVKHASQMGKSMAGAAKDMGKEHIQEKTFGGRMASHIGGNKTGGDKPKE